MTSLIKSTKLTKHLFKNNAILFTAVRNNWNKDYKPGPYPKTEAERAAAAEKYGIPLSEYKPYPDDGTGCGDYPALPMTSIDSKDPYYPWDFPEFKRNYTETVHDQFEIIRDDRWDCNAKHYKSTSRQICEFLGVMGGTFFIYWMFEKIKMFQGVIPKQFPAPGKVHYTFEKEN